jgi:hypothetical protein
MLAVKTMGTSAVGTRMVAGNGLGHREVRLSRSLTRDLHDVRSTEGYDALADLVMALDAAGCRVGGKPPQAAYLYVLCKRISTFPHSEYY